MKKIITLVAAMLLAVSAFAQEIQFQYDFARSRKDLYTNTEFVSPVPQYTATLTGTHFDKWGSTFYFVDFDFAAANNSNKCIYGEIQRSLNFWSNTALKDFYVEVEYDAGTLREGSGATISQAFLTGVAYSFHNADFSKFLQLQVLYRKFFDKTVGQQVPLQFTAVYTLKDLFSVKGLLFSGFADFWWQDVDVLDFAQIIPEYKETTHVIFSAEPQLWYNVGQHFGVDNFHIGGEVEVSYNAYNHGCNNGKPVHFTAYPAAGVRWTF